MIKFDLEKMKNKFFSLIIGLILTLNFSSYSLCMEDKDFDDLRKLEGFLNKNKISMEKVSRGKYNVNEDQFDEIFPPCHYSLGSKQINSSVGLIENEITNIITGEVFSSVGTGTIIKNDFDEISVITAKHVLEKKGKITFTLGAGLVMPGNNNPTYLAKYLASKVFFHNSQDVAYVKFRLVEKILEENKLREIVMERDHTPINNKKSVRIYHYPYGIEIQRLNNGFIIAGDDNHTIPTLGGSSGAPIILDNKIIGIHAGTHEFEGGTAKFRREIFEFCKHNYYVKMSKISGDLSDFTESN